MIIRRLRVKPYISISKPSDLILNENMDISDLTKDTLKAIRGYLRAMESLGPRDWTNPEFLKKVCSLPEYQDVQTLESRIKEWIIENKGQPVAISGPEKELVKEFIETLREELGEEIKDDPDSYSDIILNEFIDQEGILERVKKLEIPILNRPIPIQYKGFIQEANKCYIYGFHRGCIAICRTIIETAIEAALRKKRRNIYEINKMKSEEGLLSFIINEARRAGKLDQEAANKAHEIRKMANRYIHGNIPAEHRNLEEDSYKAITFVGKILEHVL